MEIYSWFKYCRVLQQDSSAKGKYLFVIVLMHKETVSKGVNEMVHLFCSCAIAWEMASCRLSRSELKIVQMCYEHKWTFHTNLIP